MQRAANARGKIQDERKMREKKKGGRLERRVGKKKKEKKKGERKIKVAPFPTQSICLPKCNDSNNEEICSIRPPSCHQWPWWPGWQRSRGARQGSRTPCLQAGWSTRLVLVSGDASTEFTATYLKVLEWDELSLLMGVPLRDEAPESSPGRPREPPGPRRLPLLLREENIEVGPRVTLPLADRFAEPLRRRRSSMPTWLLVCWL